MKHRLLFLIVVWCNPVTCKTIYLEHNSPTTEQVSFMTTYGYLPEIKGGGSATYTAQSIFEAVWKIQAFAGLPRTGVLDRETQILMKKKRCGVKDITRNSTRNRRYIIQQGWNKKLITYRVLNGSRTLEKSRVEALMAEGLAVWAPHGGLHFSQMEEGRTDIQISFASGDHGDGFPFDGPGRVVAHAFPPPHGAMHFDDDEEWGGEPDNPAAEEDVTDFFAVAVHEIGHALGLSHSNVKASVMYPYYQVPVERLHSDDILGVQKLYLNEQDSESFTYGTESPAGSRSSHAPQFTKPDSGQDDDDIPDLCFTNYDTIQVIQGKIFVFEEEWVWVLRQRKEIEPGYPRRFHDVFAGLPDYVNTVKTIYEREDGTVLIFANRTYWQFDPNFRFIKKGSISEYSIPPDVAELTTVFISNYNNKTYLIEYERFWRYDERSQTMDKGYPKDMSAWRQVPAPVESAIIWDGNTYFFRGPRFWRFDNTLVRAHEYYPLPTAQIWFPCATSPDVAQYLSNQLP